MRRFQNKKKESPTSKTTYIQLFYGHFNNKKFLSRILTHLYFFNFTCLGVAEYCEDEFFTAECKSDEVILVESALYGRMKLGRCVTKVMTLRLSNLSHMK